MTPLPRSEPPQAVSSTRLRQLVVSIINYRTAEMTLACVASVLEDIAGFGNAEIDAEVVVVDNASGDGSDRIIADWIAAQDPPVPVRLVASQLNSGFSGGHNIGMGAVAAEFYLILNSDALLRPGFCATILKAAETSPEAGLFAPHIAYDDGRQQVSCFRFASPLSELIRGAASGPLTRALPRHVAWLTMPPKTQDIQWASFACILLRGAMVRALGPMDEGYFLYFEDSEYGLRATRAGWRFAYVDAARAVHFRGGSGPVKAMAEAKMRVPGYFYAARARFLYQAHGLAGLWAANLLWSLGRLLALSRRFLGKSVPRATEMEWRDIWINALNPMGPHPGDPRLQKGPKA